MPQNNLEQQPLQINLDPNIYALSGARIIPNEEEFILQTITGSQMRQYSLSPKHAKRLLLLLGNTVTEYEKKFGELITQLPAVSEAAEKKTFGFSTTEESKEK